MQCEVHSITYEVFLKNVETKKKKLKNVETENN